MSWYSDREDFDEYDPPFCSDCEGGESYEKCRKCMREHDYEENEDYYRECDEV